MKDNILEKYYLPHQRSDETLNQAIERIDYEIIDSRFKHLTTRDILIAGVLDGSQRLD